MSFFVCVMCMTRTTLYLAMVWGLLDQQFHTWFFFWRASCRASQILYFTRTSSHFLSTSLWRSWKVVALVHDMSHEHHHCIFKFTSGYYEIHSTIINPSKHCGLPVNRERRYTLMTLRSRVRTFNFFWLFDIWYSQLIVIWHTAQCTDQDTQYHWWGQQYDAITIISICEFGHVPL